MTAVRAEELAALEFFAGCPAPTLEPLAAKLRALAAAADEELMRQGEIARAFLLVGSGRVEVTHVGDDGQPVVLDLNPGVVVGEIALLRDMPRTATVTTTEPLTGWVGDKQAFALMLELPGVMDRMVRVARQRLAAFSTPIRIRMRDDSVLHLRPVLPGDNERTVGGPVEFSRETLYRRFQSTGVPTPALRAYLFEVDYDDHFVWVMTDGEDGPVVADARFVREGHGASTAEVAFLVADAYQGRGVGSFLMEALTVAAHIAGVTHFSARVLGDNYAMRSILNRAGAHWEREDLNVVTTVVPVPDLVQLSLKPKKCRQIADTARRTIRAVS